MIQRIQSVYLLIAAIACIFLLFIPIGTFDTEQGRFVFKAFFIKDITAESGIVMTTFYIGILLAINAIFSIIAIFYYKNRAKQVRFAYINMFIFLITIALMLFVYPDYLIPNKFGIAKGAIDYNYWILLFMILTAGGLFFANKAIKKDEKMIKAADRLR
ncbi:MAG: DUF4293 domain-containing protein [Bacteroidales bacterium]|jgi:hypothetical protein|nr:DUF4293 domain-containing protein [Bacteroidales bacterium]